MTTDGTTVLVALSALVMAGPDGPIAAPGAAACLDRLELTGRVVVVAGPEVAGRRLPAETDARDQWIRQALGASAVDVVSFQAPAWDHRDAAAETAAGEAWTGLRTAADAAWLITDRPSDVRPARRAGLHVAMVGPRQVADDPHAAHAEIEARDLADAARLLLATDLFGRL